MKSQPAEYAAQRTRCAVRQTKSASAAAILRKGRAVDHRASLQSVAGRGHCHAAFGVAGSSGSNSVWGSAAPPPDLSFAPAVRAATELLV